jgi:hypothetical protein
LGYYPVDQTTFVFPRPDKDNRNAIFNMLTIREGKSVSIEVNAPSIQDKQSWVSAIRTANIASASGSLRDTKLNAFNGNKNSSLVNDQNYQNSEQFRNGGDTITLNGSHGDRHPTSASSKYKLKDEKHNCIGEEECVCCIS